MLLGASAWRWTAGRSVLSGTGPGEDPGPWFGSAGTLSVAAGAGRAAGCSSSTARSTTTASFPKGKVRARRARTWPAHVREDRGGKPASAASLGPERAQHSRYRGRRGRPKVVRYLRWPGRGPAGPGAQETGSDGFFFGGGGFRWASVAEAARDRSPTPPTAVSWPAPAGRRAGPAPRPPRGGPVASQPVASPDPGPRAPEWRSRAPAVADRPAFPGGSEGQPGFSTAPWCLRCAGPMPPPSGPSSGRARRPRLPGPTS
jgi:hypothetical protein